MSDASLKLLSELFFVLPCAVALVFITLVTYAPQLSWRSSERSTTVFCIIFTVLWALPAVGFIAIGLSGHVFIWQGLYWIVGLVLIVVSGWFILNTAFVVDDEEHET